MNKQTEEDLGYPWSLFYLLLNPGYEQREGDFGSAGGDSVEMWSRVARTVRVFM